MRIFTDFKEAIPEIKRDLAEMGIKIHTETYQDKYIKDDPNMETLEIQNYSYLVTHPFLQHLDVKNPEWAEREFLERINPKRLNPGEAWKLRKDTWEQFLEEDGRFSYTYSSRLSWQIDGIIERLKADPNSRQLYLAMWNPEIDLQRLGERRVPCSLGYWFNFRKDRLNVTYLMRSCDMNEHLLYDIYLAVKIMQYIATKAGVRPGNFCQWVGSFHVFKKDVEGVF